MAYDRAQLAANIGIQPSQLPLLAILLGSGYPLY